MDIKDVAEETSKLVLDTYRYALDNNLDIHSKDDVNKILKELDPEHSDEEGVESLMPMLDILDRMTKEELAKRDRVN